MSGAGAGVGAGAGLLAGAQDALARAMQQEKTLIVEGFISGM
jgi:hypothetical protein